MFTQYWDSLPKSIKSGLRIGSAGATHLRRLAATAAKCAGSTLHLEILQAAWEEDPLDGDLATSILQLEGRRPCFDLELKQILTLVSKHWTKPADLAHYQTYINAKQFEQGLVLTRLALREAPDNLFWRQQALTLCELLGIPEQARLYLKSGPSGLAPLFSFLRGNMYFLQGDWEHAVQEYAHAPQYMFLPYERRAEAFERLGELDKATGLRTLVLHHKPWHTNLALRTYESVRKHTTPAELPESSVAVLIYSYNKASCLDACLRSVASSNGWNSIIALNNGSTDASAEVLQSWREKIGREKFRIITLPVNIGAAAARNWLAKDAAQNGFDLVAYIDDDVLLPPDWLRSLATARTLYPGADVWGCRILDDAAPYLAQSADMHVLPGRIPSPEEDATRPDDTSLALAEPFEISDLHNQVADYGQFSYVRPCDSVTGCCHIFYTEKLLRSGPFNLQLSPSQYDDLEHDIRLASRGEYACYQGTLAVRHAKRSGRTVHIDRSAYGNWFANRFKVLRMYTAEDIQKIRVRADKRLEKDLATKWAFLDTALEVEAGL